MCNLPRITQRCCLIAQAQLSATLLLDPEDLPAFQVPMRSPKQSSRSQLSWGLAWDPAVLEVQVSGRTVLAPRTINLMPLPLPPPAETWWPLPAPLYQPLPYHLQSVPSCLFSHLNQRNISEIPI